MVGDVPMVAKGRAEEEIEGGLEIGAERGINEEALVDFMPALEIDHFAAVRTPYYLAHHSTILHAHHFK